MTEGHLVPDNTSMWCRVWLEVGHVCEPASQGARGRSLDWRLWVRGAGGADISPFVQKVVFHLHQAFVYPKRVIQEPPYELMESGYACFEVPIHVYIKHSITPKKIKLKYALDIRNDCTAATVYRNMYYDFENPNEELKKCLIKGGCQIIPGINTISANPYKRKDVDADSETEQEYNHSSIFESNVKSVYRTNATNNARKNEFLETCGLETAASVLGKMSNPEKRIRRKKSDSDGVVGLKTALRTMEMAEADITLVSQLFLSLRRYEQAADRLLLPPLSDPLFHVPSLPANLVTLYLDVDEDYALR